MPAIRRGHRTSRRHPEAEDEEQTQIVVQRRQRKDEESNDEDNNNANALQARRNRNLLNSDEENDYNDENVDEQDKGSGPVTKLVRLALAHEYQKKPIRRGDISEKVLGQAHKNNFKAIFTQAQQELRDVFGMQLVELPANQARMTMAKQRKAAAAAASALKPASQSQSTSNKSWILVSILPPEYRTATASIWNDDLVLSGISMMIVAMVYLSDRSMNENTLMRCLRRLSAEDAVATDAQGEAGTTEKILEKLLKQGYLVKLKDDVPQGTAATYTYTIGPRGKVEMGKEGVLDFVKNIYGIEAPENIEKLVQRSIGRDEEEDSPQQQAAGQANGAAAAEPGAEQPAEQAGPSQPAGRPKRGRAAPAAKTRRCTRGNAAESEDDDDDEEEEEDDDDDE